MPSRFAPTSLTDLFFTFTAMALQGFGGVLTVAQRVLVEQKQWMTLEEFVEEWSVAQILPGPNVVNLSLLFGSKHFGFSGAVVALAGILLLPLIVVLLLAALYESVGHLPAVHGALRGMGAVSAGLITAVGLKLIPALSNNVMGQWACGGVAVLTFCAIALLRVPMVYVLLSLGLLACAWAYRQLGQTKAGTA